ncbi:unnamed protein product, partial [Brassica napus]
EDSSRYSFLRKNHSAYVFVYFLFSIFFIFSAVWSQSSIYSLKRCSVLVRLSRVLF